MSLIDKALEDREKHTPKEGYDLVGIDDFEPIGEQLYTISHHETRKEALEAQKKWEHSDDTVIYPLD
jgi:hypothetical protein